MSGSTAEELGLFSLHLNTVQTTKSSQTLSTFTSIKDKGVQRVAQQHPKVFLGLGKLRHQTVELFVDKDVKPVTQCQRRISFHLRAKVQAELKPNVYQIQRQPNGYLQSSLSKKKLTIFVYVLICMRQIPLLNKSGTLSQRSMTFCMSKMVLNFSQNSTLHRHIINWSYN